MFELGENGHQDRDEKLVDLEKKTFKGQLEGIGLGAAMGLTFVADVERVHVDEADSHCFVTEVGFKFGLQGLMALE